MSLSVLRIETPAVFEPLLKPARYKGAHGGRGSAKSHHFAEAMVERALMAPGFRGLCIREVQKSLKDSAKKLIEDKILALGVGAHFEPQRDRILTPGGGVIFHDAAVAGLPPAASSPGDSDEAASGVELSDVARTVAENYGACHEAVEMVTGWQDFYRRLQDGMGTPR